MSSPSAKKRIIKLVEELPEDATVEDTMDRLYLLFKIERGIAQADSGQKISQEEARRTLSNRSSRP